MSQSDTETEKMEEYMELCFKINQTKFLEYFEKTNKIVYDNYIKLNIDNNSLEEFKNCPILFILANEPKCCSYIAIKYLEEQKIE